MSDDWAPGDLAECVDDNWRDFDGGDLPADLFPSRGNVSMVTGTRMLCHPVRGPTLTLKLMGWPLLWLEHIAFRKVPPRFEEPRVKTREEVPA